MEKEETEFNNIVQKLRAQIPENENARELSATVMKKIEHRHRVPPALTLTRIVSNTAAALLVALFIAQYNGNTNVPTTCYPQTQNMSVNKATYRNTENYNYNSKNKVETYASYLQQNINKNKQYKQFIKNYRK
jgi:type III secretory pathway component EscR